LKAATSIPDTVPEDTAYQPIQRQDLPCNNTLQLIHGDPAFNDRLLNERLTKQGLLIINVLYEKHISGDILDTLQLNDLLQIAERSLDNQKKIRSELVKHINTVFRDLGFNEDAVLRIRQTDDRRMLVYALNPRIIVEK
jgi:hypothetical protein